MPRSLLVVLPLAALALLLGALVIGGGALPSSPSSTPAVESPPAVVAPASAVPSASTGPLLPIRAGEPWYVYENAANGVSVVRTDGTDVTALPLDGADGLHTPDWSPDGSRLVMERGSEPTSQVWVVNADGSGGAALTPLDDRCAPLCPMTGWTRWSPDGRSILFIEAVNDTGRTTSWSLNIVDVASQVVREVYTATDAQLVAPGWAPGGTQVVLEVRTFADSAHTTVSGATIAIIDLNAQDPVPVPVANAPALAGRPDWSPDGSSIAVRTNPLVGDRPLDPAAGTAIWLVPTDGSPARAILDQPVNGPAIRGVSWAPDGSAILYQLRDPVTGVQTLRMIDPDGSSDRLATGAIPIEGGEPRLRPLP